MHLALYCERVLAIRKGDVPVLEKLVDVLPGEYIKRQDAITYLGLLLIGKAWHNEPVADVDAELVTAPPPGDILGGPLYFRAVILDEDFPPGYAQRLTEAALRSLDATTPSQH